MKKTLTLTVALALVALGSVSWAATRPKSSRIMQKGGPPKTDSINLNSSRSNVYKVGGPVTKVDAKNKNFAVEVPFSAKNLTDPLPEAGKIYDITFTGSTTPGGPPEVTTVHGSKSNGSSFRLKAGQSGLTGKVTQVNEKNKTFTVEVTFDGKELKALPEVGKSYDITFTQPTPGGPLQATAINSSRSNSF